MKLGGIPEKLIARKGAPRELVPEIWIVVQIQKITVVFVGVTENATVQAVVQIRLQCLIHVTVGSRQEIYNHRRYGRREDLA